MVRCGRSRSSSSARSSRCLPPALEVRAKADRMLDEVWGPPSERRVVDRLSAHRRRDRPRQPHHGRRAANDPGPARPRVPCLEQMAPPPSRMHCLRPSCPRRSADVAHDLVIDNARLIDGLGTPAAPGQPRRHGRPHRRDRRRPSGATGARAGGRGRPRARARHRGPPHPLRRPAHLGPLRHPLDRARRDHGGHRQLRLHHRPVPPGQPRSRRAQPHARGGHVARGPARRRPVGLRELSRVPGLARAPRARAQRGLVRRPLLGAHLRARRGGEPADGHRRGDRGDAADRARGAAGRRDRLRHLHARAAQRRARHPDALAAGRRARDGRAHRRARRGRPRRVHADQGHDLHGALARGHRGGHPAGR